jgi:hypothetical protein
MLIKAIDSNDRVVLIPVANIAMIEECTFPGSLDGCLIHLDTYNETSGTEVYVRVPIDKMYEALDNYSEFGYCIDLVEKAPTKVAFTKVTKLAQKAANELLTGKD